MNELIIFLSSLIELQKYAENDLVAEIDDFIESAIELSEITDFEDMNELDTIIRNKTGITRIINANIENREYKPKKAGPARQIAQQTIHSPTPKSVHETDSNPSASSANAILSGLSRLDAGIDSMKKLLESDSYIGRSANKYNNRLRFRSAVGIFFLLIHCLI